MNRTWAAFIGAAFIATAPAPAATADPSGATGEIKSDGSETGSAPATFASGPDTADPVVDGCRQFGAALDVAAANYEEFAYATAGNGNAVDYRDPNVLRTNVIGRTALREAAHAALVASRAPGLPDDVADPMRAWSLRATKLLVVMGLHGGGDTLNSNAAELNSDAHTAQMACAAHGSHA